MKHEKDLLRAGKQKKSAANAALFPSAGYIRKISISKIDRDIDDEKDWEELISQVKHVDKLLIIDDRVIVDNPIVKKYDESTKINLMKAFSRLSIQIL